MLNRCSKQTDIGLWNRLSYSEGFEGETIKTVLRTGDRSNPSTTTHIPFDMDVPVRIIERPGNREQNLDPVLKPDTGITVRLKKRIVKSIKDLTTEDLVGGTPDIATPDLVRYHLALIGNSELPSWDEVVTVYHFEYSPRAVDSDT